MFEPLKRYGLAGAGISCIVGILLCGCSIAVAAEGQLSPSAKVASEASAIELADKYTRFGATSTRQAVGSASAHLTTTVDSLAPYVSTDSQVVWSVHYDSVCVSCFSHDSLPGHRSYMAFNVILNAETGDLLRVEHRLAGRDPRLAPDPLTAEAHRTVWLGGRESPRPIYRCA